MFKVNSKLRRVSVGDELIDGEIIGIKDEGNKYIIPVFYHRFSLIWLTIFYALDFD